MTLADTIKAHVVGPSWPVKFSTVIDEGDPCFRYEFTPRGYPSCFVLRPVTHALGRDFQYVVHAIENGTENVEIVDYGY